MEEEFASATAAPETTAAAKRGAVKTALCDLAGDLRADTGFLFFRKSAVDRLRASVPQIGWLRQCFAAWTQGGYWQPLFRGWKRRAPKE